MFVFHIRFPHIWVGLMICFVFEHMKGVKQESDIKMVYSEEGQATSFLFSSFYSYFFAPHHIRNQSLYFLVYSSCVSLGLCHFKPIRFVLKIVQHGIRDIVISTSFLTATPLKEKTSLLRGRHHCLCGNLVCLVP